MAMHGAEETGVGDSGYARCRGDGCRWQWLCTVQRRRVWVTVAVHGAEETGVGDSGRAQCRGDGCG